MTGVQTCALPIFIETPAISVYILAILSGVQVKGKLFDTMLAHYVLQPELRHNMDYLAEIYLHYQTIHIDELIGARGKNQKNMRDLPPEDVYRYACEDADVNYWVGMKYWKVVWHLMPLSCHGVARKGE